MLLARRVELLLAWSEGREHEFNHVGQLVDMLGFHEPPEGVHVAYLKGCDHLFTTEGHRTRLFGMFHRWLVERFPSAATAAGRAPGVEPVPSVRSTRPPVSANPPGK